jgi:hypothetical protein
MGGSSSGGDYTPPHTGPWQAHGALPNHDGYFNTFLNLGQGALA